MARVLHFTDSQLKQLQDVRAASIDDIMRVLTALKNLQRRIIRVSSLNKIAEEALPSNPRFAAKLTRFAILLSTSARRAGMSELDVQSSLEKTAAKLDGSDPSGSNRWALVAQVAFAESIYLSAKALDLSFDFERLFSSAKFLTDVRPVFDEAGAEPMGAVVVHNLHMDFYQGDQFVSLCVAFDETDIRDLISACQKALTKQASIAKLLPNLNGDEIFVAGDERNVSDS